MSSPSPGPQAPVELAYQPSEPGDHIPQNHGHAPQAHGHAPPGLGHACPCADATETPRCDCGHAHHHGKNHTHHHGGHALVPKVPSNAANVTCVACACHLQQQPGPGEPQEIRESVAPARKLEPDDSIEVSPLPPALPPRPPPRPRTDGHGTLTSRTRSREATGTGSGGGIRKYVFWCTICGGFATVLGALFLAVYFMLRSYTSTLIYFETIPTFVPATMLILTGLCVMSLARRRNRYSYLIKVCGVCCLVCALTCVLVTITTTVIHMNRLQTLRECVYTQKTRTCTCYSVLLEAHADTDEGTRFVFDSTPDCEVIHGALYSCLRAMFGLSVSGILVCIFSCMLVYQLLSHERKKMYWEQLELRCRSLYQQQGTMSTQGSGRGPAAAPYCSCCEECRYPPAPAGPAYPWDTHHALERFWAPGRVGNFYSPNPGEEGPPAADRQTRERAASGWSWRRLPWSRGSSQPSLPGLRQNVSSPDSQYGFSNRGEAAAAAGGGPPGPYGLLDGRAAAGVYVWGPPPPYSNPNSPARRALHSPARYHHLHHHPHAHPHATPCLPGEQGPPSSPGCPLRRAPAKDNYENTADTEVHQADGGELTDTSSGLDRACSGTLPARKTKKRMDLLSPRFSEGPCEPAAEEPAAAPDAAPPADGQSCRFLPRLQGVENAAFQNQEPAPPKAEPSESEVYFADVSSCCNISVRTDGHDSSLYDEALEAQKSRLVSLQCAHKQARLGEPDAEDYLAHRIGKRQLSTRSRLPFPLPSADNLTLSDLSSESCLQLLAKDVSQNSLGSAQTPLTETTDDSASPMSPAFGQADCCLGYFPEQGGPEPQLHRHRPFSGPGADQFLAPDAQYEIIQQQASAGQGFRQNYPDDLAMGAPAAAAQASFSNLTNTISGLNNFGSQNFPTQEFSPGQGFSAGQISKAAGQTFMNNPQNFVANFDPASTKSIPPKTLNLNNSPRRGIGSNISTLIQNLGVIPVGLLYAEANSTDEEIQGQACHSDGTMDSGWQSGSEKQDGSRQENNADAAVQRSVNI